MIRIDLLTLVMRLTFVLLMALGFVSTACIWVTVSLGWDQLWGLWGLGCAVGFFVFAAMVHDALEAQ